MYTIARNREMPRRKKEGPSRNFQLRLSGEEAERWLKIRELALERNPRCNDTDINRRLLGLDPDIDGLITEKDRLYFLGAKAAHAEMLGRAEGKKPLIREVSRKLKR
jgi:hypothetical protein